MYDVLHPIRGEIAGVWEKMSRFYKIRAGYINDFAHLEKHAEKYICPALVLYSARICGKVTDRVISLAMVFQFIHLAAMVHCNINEDSQNRDGGPADPRDGCQYPVLVGDYLYGRFFTTLCDADIIKYLGPLSEIICMINEGSIMRIRNQDGGMINPVTKREIIRLESGELMAGCCRLAGDAAGAGAEQQQRLYNFGHAMGMALGMAWGEWHEQAGAHFSEALSCLEMFSPGKDRDNLKSLVVYLKAMSAQNNKMVC